MGATQFTFEKYNQALTKALDVGVKFSTFQQTPDAKKRVWLRHDVDFTLGRAKDLALIENKLGIQTTYFVMVNNPFYNILTPSYSKIIHDIKQMGHQIGLHFDRRLLGVTRNAEEEIYAILEHYKNFLPISDIVSFHRPEEWVFDLNTNTFTNVYNKEFFNKIEYRSDSKREIKNLEKVLTNFDELQLLLHPVWWHDKLTT